MAFTVCIKQAIGPKFVRQVSISVRKRSEERDICDKKGIGVPTVALSSSTSRCMT